MTIEAQPSILVMMATYNGERFVREQIKSILNQKQVSVTLRICDDRSSDKTFDILDEYAKTDTRLIISQNSTTYGVGKNFMQMVYEEHDCLYDYYAFADQDDIWLPQKLNYAVEQLSKKTEPALYYSDVTNFDDYHSWSELESYKNMLDHTNTLLVRNWACGCTMVFNEALQNLLCKYQPDTFPRIHDSWVHAVARYCGEVIDDLEHSYIRRRISGQNVVGQLTDHHVSLTTAIEDASHLLSKSSHAPTAMACQLVEGYAAYLKPESLDPINELLSYHDSLSSRFRVAMHFDLWMPTLRGRIITRACFLLHRY